jgi:predicted branched-subunit amino acid permease
LTARADQPASAEFLDGAKSALPVVVAALPFGLLFGAVAVNNGLSVFEAVLMSATIFGGASQMVGIDLFGQRIAPWVVVLSIFAVNFRHVLYSAAIGSKLRHMTRTQRAAAFFFLTDPQYAEAEKRHERGRRIGFAWYAGLALPIYGAWVAETWAGAVFGRLIQDPEALGLDYLLPIYFLGLVLEFRTRAGWLSTVAASAAGSIAAFWMIGSPWHVSLGALCGIAVAAATGGGSSRAVGGGRGRS